MTTKNKTLIEVFEEATQCLCRLADGQQAMIRVLQEIADHTKRPVNIEQWQVVVQALQEIARNTRGVAPAGEGPTEDKL